MKERDFNILEHIIVYCEDIKRSIKRYGDSFEIFSSDTDYRNSISMSLQQIGELANHLSKEFQIQTQNQQPWRKIVDLRNRFVHGYLSIRIEMTYNVAKFEIPELYKFCKDIIEHHLSQQNNAKDKPSNHRFRP